MSVRTVREAVIPQGTAEELQLWADYYEAIVRALELVRSGLTTEATLPQILAEDAKAAVAIKRIKEIRGIKN